MQHLENARYLRSSSIFVIYPWRPWWLASRELRAISRICPSQSPVCRNIVEPLTFLLCQADQAQNWKFAWHFSSALDRAINPLFLSWLRGCNIEDRTTLCNHRREICLSYRGKQTWMRLATLRGMKLAV